MIQRVTGNSASTFRVDAGQMREMTPVPLRLSPLRKAIADGPRNPKDHAGGTEGWRPKPESLTDAPATAGASRRSASASRGADCSARE